MERLPKIIIMIAAMTAIFLWVSTAFNSCGDKDLIDEMEVVADQDDTDVFSDDLGDDIFGDEADDEDLIFEESEPVEEEEYVETDFTADVDDEPAYTPPPSRPASVTSAGEYMVIAGNYLIESNARDMINKLSNLGYGNAEIGIFERSQYHTVIASRHASRSAAIQASSDIKYKGIEAYVKKKTY